MDEDEVIDEELYWSDSEDMFEDQEFDDEHSNDFDDEDFKAFTVDWDDEK